MWYFPPPGTTVNSGVNNTVTNNITNISGAVGGGMPSGDVVVQRAGNIWIAYMSSANTAAARGAALYSGAQAALSGDTIFLGPGFFDLADATVPLGLGIPAGVTLVGVSPLDTHISTSLVYSTRNPVVVSGTATLRDLTIEALSPTGNSAVIAFNGVGANITLDHVNLSNYSSGATAFSVRLSSGSPYVTLYSCNINGGALDLNTGVLEFHDSYYINTLSAQNMFGGSAGTVFSYNSQFINAPTGVGTFSTINSIATNSSATLYGGFIAVGNGSTGDAVRCSNIGANINLNGVRVIASGGVGIRNSSTGYVRINDCFVSGAVIDLVRSNGNILIDGYNTFNTTSGVGANFKYAGNQGLLNAFNAATFTGSLLQSNAVTINTVNSGYTQAVSDILIAFTGLSGGTVNLLAVASAVSGRSLIVKDQGGSGAISNITITPNGAEKIDGASTKVINTAFGSVKLYNNGVNWFTY
jgi:hypothetical protein